MKVEKQYSMKVYAVEGTPYHTLIGGLLAAAGGVTTTQGTGWWMDKNGKPVQEPVTIVEVHCTGAEAAGVADAVDAYIGACIKGGQECVGIFTDGEDCQPVFTMHYEVPA